MYYGRQVRKKRSEETGLIAVTLASVLFCTLRNSRYSLHLLVIPVPSQWQADMIRDNAHSPVVSIFVLDID